MEFIKVKMEPFEEIFVEEQEIKQECLISETDFDPSFDEPDILDDPIKQEEFHSEIDIDEDSIKLEPGENLPGHRSDVEPRLCSKLAECRVLVRKLLECQSCCFYTNNKTQLATHMQVHQPTNTKGDGSSHPTNKDGTKIKCGQCDIRYSNRDVLAWHTENCHGTKPTVKVIKVGDKHNFQCIFCETVNNNFGVIIQHLCSEHKRVNLPFRCSYCDKLFLYRKDLNLHKRKCESKYLHMVQVPKVMCNLCNKLFKSEKRLTMHISRFHTSKERFNCEHCSEKFAYLTQLKSHCDVTHPGQPFAQCAVCQAEFSVYNCYKMHIKYKHGPHVFTCKVCPATFTYPYNLKRHMQRQHCSLKQTFSCKVCKANFKCKEYLTRHVQFIHSGRFLYCEHCDYCTRKKYHLLRHFERCHF